MTDERIKEFISELLAESVNCEPVKNQVSGFIKFNSKELWKMPKEFRKPFVENGSVAHIKKFLEKGVIYYEIKYGNIVVKNKNLKKAKKEFITITKRRKNFPSFLIN